MSAAELAHLPAFLSRALPSDPRLALSGLTAALAEAGRFDEALTTLGQRGLDEFLRELSKWPPSFEQVETGLAVAVLREATGIIGWVRPDWQKIHEILSA